jgi:succinoglycan biosynthesis protein ExoA
MSRGLDASEPAGSDPTVDVTVIVPVLNEAADIHDAAAAMRAQEFPGRLEFLLIDGRSEDGTREILRELARQDDRFRLLDNPERGIPQALNIGLREARGRFVARMDAHALYPTDYLTIGVARLERGGADYVSGPPLPHGVDTGSRRVALALESPLGVGGAGWRRVTQETETDAGFTGLWRRETLERLGGWSEDWAVNEDGELSARLLKAGGRIFCLPEMATRYVPRRSLRALVRQYWRYGQYRAKTSRRHPESMRRSHLLPPAVTLVLVGALLPIRAAAPLRVAAAGYAIVLAGEAAWMSIRSSAPRDAAWLPAILAAMHLAWGSGFLVGSAKFGVPLGAIRATLRVR